MNIITPIKPMLTDEHVLAVHPTPSPEGIETVHKRLNAFQGRALSAQDLSGLQVARMAHQALLHRWVSGGIIEGLEIDWIKPDIITVSAGSGLTTGGEDIFLGVSRQFQLAELAVIVPRSGDKPQSIQAMSEFANSADAKLSHAGVLVAVPVSMLGYEASPLPPNEFVPRDPIDDPYSGLMETDGCVFALFPLPPNQPGKPTRNFDPAVPSFRNNLVNAIFEDERNLKPGEVHPWQDVGLPLALLGFNANGTLQFIDRSSVARAGGQARDRALADGTGTPALWQARAEQFAEQVVGLGALPESMASLSQVFPKLPPIGLMPKRMAGFATGNSIFPERFNIKALPVPEDQLTTIFQDCSALDPVDLSKPEDIEIAIPVPVAEYDPHLLWPAVLAPDFDQAIAAKTSERNDWIKRRETVRAAHDQLILSQTGVVVSPAASDAQSDDERIISFAARRLTKLANGEFVEIDPEPGAAQMTIQDRIYIWTKFEREMKGEETFELFIGLDPKFLNEDSSQQLHISLGAPLASTQNLPDEVNVIAKPDGWFVVTVPGILLVPRDLVDSGVVGKEHLVNLTSVQVLSNTEGPMIIAEWGIQNSAGQEYPILSDAIIGSSLSSVKDMMPGDWPWLAPSSVADEPDFGAVVNSANRRVPLLDQFSQKILATAFLGPDKDRLSKLPVGKLIDVLIAQINATNDVVDRGFLQARTNSFRVREFMLGSDAASRLLTSPALADVVKQNTSARVTGEQLENFLQRSNRTIKMEL